MKTAESKPEAIPNKPPSRAASVRGVKPIPRPYPAWARQPEPDPAAPMPADDEAEALPPDRTEEQPAMPATAAAPSVVVPLDTLPEPQAQAVQPQATGSLVADAELEPARGAVVSLLDSLAGPRLREAIRVHVVRPDGVRGPMLFQVAANEHPDDVRAKIAKHGPGEYELAPVVDGVYRGQSRRLVIDPPPVAASAAPAAPAPAAAGLDVSALVSGLAAMQREAQTENARMMERVLSAQKDAQIDMLKIVAGQPRDGGNGGNIMEAILPLILARMTEDPLDRIIKMQDVNQRISAAAAPPDRTAEVLANIAATLPAVLAAGAQAAPAPAQRRAVLPVPAPAGVQAQPQAVAPAAPSPAPAVADDVLRDVLPVLRRLAAKGADAGTVLGALSAILTDAEVSAALPLLAQPSAASLLVTLAPELADFRPWIDAMLSDVRELFVQDASAENAPG